MSPRLLAGQYRYLQRCAKRFGDVVRLPLPGVDLYLVSHPDGVAQVLSSRDERYVKGAFNTNMASGRYLGLPLADGEPWRRVRRLLNPMFGAKQLRELSGLMRGAVEDRVETWEKFSHSGETIQLERELSTVTMSVLLRSMFAAAETDDDVDRCVDDFQVYARLMGWRQSLAWTPQRMPLPYARRGVTASRNIARFIDRLIAERRANPTDTADLLNLLLQARFDDGEPLTDKELRVEIVGLLFGGFETTAAALAWSIAFLDLHPGQAKAVYDEIDGLPPGPLREDSLSELVFTRAWFNESQRLQGSLLLTRTPVEDDVIGGYRIPRGSIVGVSPYALHRDERFWPDPDVFDASRFVESAPAKNTFLPFGAGPRHCIGANMAYMEAMYVLAAALRQFRFRLPAGFTPRQQFHLSTGIKGGLPVTMHRRDAEGGPTNDR